MRQSKKRLEYRAEAWAKMADLRERNLQAKTPRHRHQPANKISDEREEVDVGGSAGGQ